MPGNGPGGIEDIAHLLRKLLDVSQVGALLTRDLLDGEGTIRNGNRNHLRHDAECGVLGKNGQHAHIRAHARYGMPLTSMRSMSSGKVLTADDQLRSRSSHQERLHGAG